jgi:hypothetical protein
MLTSKFLTRVEANMRVIQENTYAAALKNLWWKRVATELPSTASAEHLFFLITGGAMDYASEGNREFLEQAVARIDAAARFFTVPGIEILKSELDDSDGAGLHKATQWSAETAAKAALFAQQKLAAELVTNPVCYDGQPFFSVAHPNMLGDLSAGLFANDFTGAASGDYPGASPLTGTDVAADNETIGKVLAYIRGLKGPDGQTCLNLEPKAFLGSPTQYRLGLNAVKAEFVGGTVGSTDVRAQVNDFGLDMIRAGELAGNPDYYILCEQLGSTIGPWAWINREAPNTSYYGPMNDAQLARMDKFQWGMRGRGVIAPGRPLYMFRCRAS